MITNKRHIAFVDTYMKNGMNATAAYKTVYKAADGVCNVNGPRLLLNNLIATEIAKRQKINSKNSNKTKDDIISDLELIIEEFKLTGKLTTNTLKAIEILNKMKGWNEADRVDITSAGQPIIKIDLGNDE